jgi:hypothetical protein
MSMFYSRKTNVLSYLHQPYPPAILHTSSINNLVVFFKFKIACSESCWFFIFWVHKFFRLYSFHNVPIFFSGLFICAILYVRHVQVRICLGSLEFSHVYWCQHTWMQKFASVCFCRFSLMLLIIPPIKLSIRNWGSFFHQCLKTNYEGYASIRSLPHASN